MKKLVALTLLLTILCYTALLSGCTEDKEVATKDEATVITTTATSTETTASQVVTGASATEATNSTVATTAVTQTEKETEVQEQNVVNNSGNTNNSYNGGSNNQNSNSTGNETVSSNTDKSTTNSNKGKVTKIVFDNDYITMDVGDVVNVGFAMDGIPSEIHCNLGQPNHIKAKVKGLDSVQVTACRAGEATFTLTTETGVSATCTVYVNYPSVENITYDEILTYDQINTEKVTKIICDELNAYFPTLGMTYDSSLGKDDGWFFGHHCSAFGTTDKSLNEMIESIREFIIEQVDAVCIEMHGGSYDIMNFKMDYFVEGDSYVIIFCYS